MLREGFRWERHYTGHLIYLEEQPAVQQLQEVLGHFINCNTFQISTIAARHLEPLENFTATDAIVILLDIITSAGIWVKSFS